MRSTSVACSVAAAAVGVAVFATAGAGAHIASDRAFQDEYQVSVGKSFFRAGFSTGSGVARVFMFTQGYLGSAAFPAGAGLFGSRIGILGMWRAVPALVLANLAVLKQGVLAGVFGDDC